MIKSLKHMLQVAAFAGVAVGAGPAFAAEPTGIWYDHTGRGAVEIVKCGSNLCGKLVWLKNASHKEGCGLQIIGDVKPLSSGVWDGGWIYRSREGPQDQIQRRADAYESQVAEGRRLPGHEVPQRDHDVEARAGDLKRCGA